MANVAQLVEPRFVVPVVVGSSPIVRPRLNNFLPLWQVFFMGERRFAFSANRHGAMLSPIPTKFVVSAKQKLPSQQKVSLLGS